MGLHTQPPAEAVPPIILLIEPDPDTRDMYSMSLESSGMWVATAPNPGAAAEAMAELKPDLVVTDLVFDAEETGLEFAHALRHDASTAHVPLVFLSGRSQSDMALRNRCEADLFLVKPVLPDDLAGHIRVLLNRSHELRARNQAALQRASALVQRSNELRARARRIGARVNSTARRCPSCGHSLQWVETGRIEGSDYDYYHWCERGCGLHCFDRTGHRWVKLAG